MGYSAITALLIGLYAKVGLVTFHGPMILNGFSEYPQPFAYTWEGIEQVLFKTEPVGALKPPATMDGRLYERGSATRDENESGLALVEKGKSERTSNWWKFKRYIDTSRYAILGPRCKAAILCFEEVNFGSGLLRKVDGSLAQCQQMGLFDQIAGLVIGKVNELSEEEEKLFESLILEYTVGSQFPILTGGRFWSYRASTDASYRYSSLHSIQDKTDSV